MKGTDEAEVHLYKHACKGGSGCACVCVRTSVCVCVCVCVCHVPEDRIGHHAGLVVSRVETVRLHAHTWHTHKHIYTQSRHKHQCQGLHACHASTEHGACTRRAIISACTNSRRLLYGCVVPVNVCVCVCVCVSSLTVISAGTNSRILLGFALSRSLHRVTPTTPVPQPIPPRW